MTPATLATVPSILPTRPGSVEVHLICECGSRCDVFAHGSVRDKFVGLFRRVHQKPGCAVTEVLP